MPAGCAMEGEGMNELPPSLLPLCRFTCHLHGAVTERMCDLGGGCTPCTPFTACDLHTSDARTHSFSPLPRRLTLHVQARKRSCDAVWLWLHPLALLVAASPVPLAPPPLPFLLLHRCVPVSVSLCVQLCAVRLRIARLYECCSSLSVSPPPPSFSVSLF